jgi:hypothetical protein
MSFDFSFNMLFISNFPFNRIDGVMVNMLVSRAVDRGFKPQSEWLFFNANSAIFQLYHGENKLIFN